MAKHWLNPGQEVANVATLDTDSASVCIQPSKKKSVSSGMISVDLVGWVAVTSKDKGHVRVKIISLTCPLCMFWDIV